MAGDGAAGGGGYRRARTLLLVAGLAVLLLIAALTYIRGVEPIEVAGTLLFLPVFVAVVLWGAAGGLVAGALAAVAYALLRMPAIDAVGAERFIGLIASRALAYIAFGGVAGWAAGRLERSILKLELYDHIDDATGLHNARFFVQQTELEAARAKRYETLFSVCVVDLPRGAVGADGRAGRKLLRELGHAIAASIRSVDRAVHVREADRHRFAVILPETSREGADVFTGRFVTQLTDRMRDRGATVEGELTHTVATVPGQEAELETLREQFAAVDREEHPARST